ncbi:hypothetical protein N7G274_009973 [Stereocaulon virgatum]|uniref:Fe2OG dioxygenase domain-containing protein n=1 Tax=Stereocaulon virgatum TaxID=373712 RepID=A0ABR3ZVU0_9LECA
MKRKVESDGPPEASKKAKRQAASHKDHFRDGLFDQSMLKDYQKAYAASKPYRHGVIANLISPTLLIDVRSEVQNLSFTPKETDIYKIHQSGDLANLDGLDDSSLKLLPSLLTLRDAMYSSAFREYLSAITGSGPLSGKKTDMAINVYTPSCHLLCHDDVIGSRRVSYILYLTDPDNPWKEEWGGALRLYPTQTHDEKDGQSTKVPEPDHSVSIPPAFNQLSFFAVQPGESFHDVEEVYSPEATEQKYDTDARVRIAISGWYHIPQRGEDGFVEGLEEQLAEKSSLMQLHGKGDKYDLPEANVQVYGPANTGETGLPTPSSQEDPSLSEEDLNLLLKYLTPTYLTPDTLESISSFFAEECSLCLDSFLCRTFVNSVREYVESQESQTLPTRSVDVENLALWTVARPPHKHRFLFQQANHTQEEPSPLQDLVRELLPSTAFQKWLSLATGHQITSHNSLIRRFRRGHDYTLATGYEEDNPRIELCLAITPTSGWSDEQSGETGEVADTNKPTAKVCDTYADKGTTEADKRTSKVENTHTDERTAEADKSITKGNGTHTDERTAEADKSVTKGNGTHTDKRTAETDKPTTEEDGTQTDERTAEADKPTTEEDDTHTDQRTAEAEKPITKGNVTHKDKRTAETDKPTAEENGTKTDKRTADADQPTKEENDTQEDKQTAENPSVGGYLAYMAGEDDDEAGGGDAGSDHGVEVPLDTSTGARSTKAAKPKKAKQDPAIYQAGGEDEDDGVLFSMPASWNRLGLVLRDKGTMRFVKYVSRMAKGDRWDILGEFGIVDDEDEYEGEEPGRSPSTGEDDDSDSDSESDDSSD